MKHFLFNMFLCLLFGAGCTLQQQMHLPALIGTKVAEQQQSACATVFPQGKWQFVHSIAFTMKEGTGPVLIGVTTIDGDTIGCALVTVEGLTLFEAIFQGTESVVVRRALPPFDKPEFAEGLISDIRAIFQPPTAKAMMGQLAGATTICRYKEASGAVIDIELTDEDDWQIRGYSSESLLQQTITGRSCRKIGASRIPHSLELKTYGPSGYTLRMTLLQADTMP